ncbi:MAG: hypothetical protein B7Z29_01975 [Hyphomicrobium sp. 12-62-95]|nr:MAG: hypothetical protein B7Z29_01975 [Hyphomicrobium sp. 12-62-95]
MRDLVRRPRLFNDRMPAGRCRARLERFRRWCGPCLWQVLCDAELKRYPPPASFVDAEVEDRARTRRQKAKTSTHGAGYVAVVDMIGAAK